MRRTVTSERGSVVLIAVIAMLIMGVLAVSFSLLSNIESRIGFNYKQQAQAEALAETGLNRARDAMRTAGTRSDGFTCWLQGTCPGPLINGPLLFNNVSLGAGTYSATVDNDCSPVIPPFLQQAGCPTTTDTNETVVVTAWASAGVGRARVKAILAVDNPWKHVCSNSSQDNSPGYCNEPSNENGTPAISPADPNDPNGPQAYDSLPTPALGCSQIDPTMHGGTSTTGTCGTGRQVLAGDRALANCDGGGIQYQGYFDCALTTPCAPASACPGNQATNACVKATDTRAGTPGYVAVGASGCPDDPITSMPSTGMVFNYYGSGTRNAPTANNLIDPTFNSAVGGNGGGLMNAGDGRNIYVMNRNSHGQVTVQNASIYGVLAIEGDGLAQGCGTGPGSARDLSLKNNGVLTTKQHNSTNGQTVYGYPLAVLIYDPTQPVPSASNPYTPQNTCADMGSSNTLVNGMVYSGGHVQFNPISVNGTVVGFELQTQGGNNANLGYNWQYGDAAPPPGFALGANGPVSIIRKSFVVCTVYAANSTTPCQ